MSKDRFLDDVEEEVQKISWEKLDGSKKLSGFLKYHNKKKFKDKDRNKSKKFDDYEEEDYR